MTEKEMIETGSTAVATTPGGPSILPAVDIRENEEELEYEDRFLDLFRKREEGTG